MNAKTKRSPKQESGPCLCQGAGPLLSEWLKRLGPPEPARRHFDAARLEFLKGLRAMLDARIAQCSKPNAKGEKIDVE
ncbi:MAG TPA: hypothetical protein VN829_01830 [Dongiaceae bacterium]|nr:conserved hypothetical protein [Verrucomicrobiota bacterium]HXP59197.1 hypothetical protein [Dongiaceae bacterium]